MANTTLSDPSPVRRQCVEQTVDWNLTQIGPIATYDDWQNFVRKDLLPLTEMHQACVDLYRTAPEIRYSEATKYLAEQIKRFPYYQTRMTPDEKKAFFAEFEGRIQGPTPDHFWSSVGWGSLVIGGGMTLAGAGSLFFWRTGPFAGAIGLLADRFEGYGVLAYLGISLVVGAVLGAGLGQCRNEWEKRKREIEIDNLLAG